MAKSNRIGLFVCILLILYPISLFGMEKKTGEELYKKISMSAKGLENQGLIKELQTKAGNLDWQDSGDIEFTGNLRLITQEKQTGQEGLKLFLLRELSGDIYVLPLPKKTENSEIKSFYSELEKSLSNKLDFKVRVKSAVVNGDEYAFAQFVQKPQQLALDKIFKIAIILMLFFVMIGMGLTLTLKEFALVFTSPRGIILGEILQFGIMPFIAMIIGHLLGFYEYFPFIFVGMILITATPGGVTSNLMTYYAKGDLALSISMTSFSTVLSLIFTPLLLSLYCAGVPEVAIPVKIIVQTMLVLVIVPLIIGMSVRSKWPEFAAKTTKIFALLGIIALLFLIIAGILSNLHAFADTERHGVLFYTMVFSLTTLGMITGIIFPKLAGVNNYQTRAISLESGLRNASLAMAIALLIQDLMGDFYSSMFITSGMFGLGMYIAGFICIASYKKILPVEAKEVS
jgi:predicted Na+-dependent transporter